MDTTASTPPSGAHAPEPARQQGKATRRTVLAAAALILLLALGAVVLWLLGAARPTPVAPSSSTEEPTTPANPAGEPGSADLDLAAPTTYTVEPGDSLAAIADSYGTSMDALRVANGLTNVDVLQIGQVLTIPPAETRVESIDPRLTLNDAARSYDANPRMLAAYNGLDQARADVPLGRNELVVPDRSRLASPPAVADGTGGGGDETLYTVADGDTLLSIAAQFDVDPDAIIAANQIEDPDRIVSGVQLRIPTGP